jgi:outer membrane lipoprotein carrier protein
MLKKTVTTLSIGIFLLFINTANAEQAPIKQLKSFLATTKSLTADFKQVKINENGHPVETSHGVFYLSRPGKFRWNYQTPYVQSIVSNEKKVWFYDADLEQVTVKKMDDSLGATPALLLSGNIELEKNFILKKQGTNDDMLWVKLSPKNEESEFKYILIGLDNGILGGMELSDNFGQLTRVYFSKVKINPPLLKELFEFKVPEGVDVFEN